MIELKDAETTEQWVEKYIETAYLGYSVVRPVAKGLLGIGIFLVAIPFFLIGAITRGAIRLSRGLESHIPDSVENRALFFFMWQVHMMFEMVYPMESVAISRDLQTRLSDWD